MPANSKLLSDTNFLRGTYGCHIVGKMSCIHVQHLKMVGYTSQSSIIFRIQFFCDAMPVFRRKVPQIFNAPQSLEIWEPLNDRMIQQRRSEHPVAPLYEPQTCTSNPACLMDQVSLRTFVCTAHGNTSMNM